jgi:SAM-dependent methyltransferase
MFFAERIKNIAATDKVLEIGPGASPHPRSDILLELEYTNEADRSAQFGHGEKLVSDKKIVYYDGKKFPFKDKEFDYIICSHVLEHVEDVPGFLQEVFRIANKGYFEYPMVYYDYIYNFDVHVNFLKYDDGCLKFMKKNKTGLNEFKPVQQFFNASLQKGYFSLVNELSAFLMEGFEWDKPFKIEEAKKLEEVCHANFVIPEPKTPLSPSSMQLLKQLVKRIIK